MQICNGTLYERNLQKIESGALSRDVCRTVAAALLASSSDNGRPLNAKRGRSQREMIRDVMLAASDCGTWLTLGELRALTSYGEASISAQLRHLRKPEYGGYELLKRHRENTLRGVRGESLWEYRLKQCGEVAA
jgi:hypothetical protein